MVMRPRSWPETRPIESGWRWRDPRLRWGIPVAWIIAVSVAPAGLASRAGIKRSALSQVRRESARQVGGDHARGAAATRSRCHRCSCTCANERRSMSPDFPFRLYPERALVSFSARSLVSVVPIASPGFRQCAGRQRGREQQRDRGRRDRRVASTLLQEFSSVLLARDVWSFSHDSSPRLGWLSRSRTITRSVGAPTEHGA